MKSFNVLHLSNTPLVGAPGKISEALNKYTNIKSSWLIENDYPNHLANFFTKGGISLKFKNDATNVIKEKYVKTADIIHIHNFISDEMENYILKNSKTNVKFIYHVHSPLREGPLFIEYDKYSNIQFDKKFVVGQYQPRLFPDFEIMPNITMFKPSLNLLSDDDKINIIFSPSHSITGGRWNDKVSTKLIEKKDNINFYNLNKIAPEELYLYRRDIFHITIDEIITGSFHQISLEAMAAGNVVINNSDFFTDQALLSYCDKKEEIPFYKVNEYNLEEKLSELIKNKELVREYQKKSYNFFINNLLPEKLIKRYEYEYRRIL